MRNPILVGTGEKRNIALDIPQITVEQLLDQTLKEVSFFLVDYTDPQAGHLILKQIRAHELPEIYLKPILACNASETPRDILEATDDVIAPGTPLDSTLLSQKSAQVEQINVRIDSLREISPEGDMNIAFKILRFMFTRGGEFKPQSSINHRDGYCYPDLQTLFADEDFSILETFEYLESENLIEGSFVNKSYACTHCGCAFLNFSETCPDCESSDLLTDELIHHFKCAYVGEMSDFRQGPQLICPKCDNELKHIGVDYDKPSIVYHCRSCKKITQEPRVMTSCYSCGRWTEPENQVNRVINSFSLTSIGENGARYGMSSLLQRVLEQRVNALPYDFFKEFFRVEFARIKRYKVSTSCLTILQIENINRIYEQMGKRSSEIFAELSELLKSELRTSDIFSVRDETIFLALYTETPPENVELAVSRLENRIVTLLQNNLKMNFDIHRKIVPLSDPFEIDDAIESFLKEIHAA